MAEVKSIFLPLKKRKERVGNLSTRMERKSFHIFARGKK